MSEEKTKFLISGYDSVNDVFENYESFTSTLDKAEEKFEEYIGKFNNCELNGETGEPVDFIALYDVELNERVDYYDYI